MSDGYYKYRCKNFYSHNCTNWVWMNNTVCAACIAAGHEDQVDTCGSRHTEHHDESPVNPANADLHLSLDTEDSGDLIKSCTRLERTGTGISIDITANSKGLGDLFEPDSNRF